MKCLEDQYQPPNKLRRIKIYFRDHRPGKFGDFNLMINKVTLNNFAAIHQTNIQVTNLLLNGRRRVRRPHSVTRQVRCNPATTPWRRSARPAGGRAATAADSAARKTLRKIRVDGPAPGDGIALPRGDATGPVPGAVRSQHGYASPALSYSVTLPPECNG